MITEFAAKTAVITGAGSGFGLACARLAAQRGMNLVLVDVQKDALDTVCTEIQAMGTPVMARRVDVSHSGQMQSLADDVWDDSDDADDTDPPSSRRASNPDRPIQPTLGFTLDPARA